MNDIEAELHKQVDTPILDVVRVVIVDEKGRVLLVKEHDDENWKLPGGKIHEGETIMQAIAREIKEELDCEISIKQIAKHVKATIPHSEHYRHIVLVTIDPKLPKTTDEVIELLWTETDHLPDGPYFEHMSTAIQMATDPSLQ